MGGPPGVCIPCLAISSRRARLAANDLERYCERYSAGAAKNGRDTEDYGENLHPAGSVRGHEVPRRDTTIYQSADRKTQEDRAAQRGCPEMAADAASYDVRKNFGFHDVVLYSVATTRLVDG